ncbi:MAG: PadR family transcriptional regulator [Lachnospiraceae bacterium]|nr:PadR family transcriptional regulator [Lachnospiraceae bacterium]
MAREKKIDMVILGLLFHEDLTGYDIKKRIDGAISFFWKGSFGNIYPSLKDMQTRKLIQSSDTSVGGREKITYHITEEGKEALKEWLNEDLAINELRYETLLKLFFSGAGSRKTALHNIENFEKQIKTDLELLKVYCKNLENNMKNEDHLYYYLTVTFGIDSYEAYLKWCTKAKKMLRLEAR